MGSSHMVTKAGMLFVNAFPFGLQSSQKQAPHLAPPAGSMHKQVRQSETFGCGEYEENEANEANQPPPPHATAVRLTTVAVCRGHGFAVVGFGLQRSGTHVVGLGWH